MWLIESNIPVLLNLLNTLWKRDQMLGKRRILSLFTNSFNKFNKNMCAHIKYELYEPNKIRGLSNDLISSII